MGIDKVSGCNRLTKEGFLSVFMAGMPLCRYLGIAIYYNHFVLLSVLMIFIFKNKIFSKKFSPSELFVGAYFLFMIFANFIPNDFDQLNNSLDAITVAVMSIMTCRFAEFLFFSSARARVNQEIAIKTLVVSFSVVSLIIINGYLLDINIIRSVNYGKLIEFHDFNYHSLQNYIAIGTGFLIYYVIRNRTVLNFIFIALFFGATLLTQGRTATVVASLSVAIFIILAFKSTKKIMAYSFTAILLVLTLLTVSYISSGDPFAFSKIHSSKRVAGGAKYIDYVLDHSPVTGLGLGGAGFLRQEKVIPYGSPHNIVLDAFVSNGFVGLTVFSAFLAMLFAVIKKIAVNCKTNALVRALLVTVPVAIFVDGQAYLSIWSTHNMTLIIFYILLVIAIAKTSIISTVQKEE